MFGDESHILYVNSQIKDETELGKLMHDFSCTDAKDMHYKILADRVRYFKEDAKGVETMCRAMEDIHYRAKPDGARPCAASDMRYTRMGMRKEAVVEDRLQTLRNLMKNLGLTAKQALVAMGISESDKGILIKKL